MYRIKAFSFLAKWLAASIFVWPASVVALGAVFFPLGMIYSLFRPSYYDTRDVYYLLGQAAILPIMGAVIGLVLSNFQHFLLRSQLFWAADGWRLWSMVGGAVGGFVLFIVFQTDSANAYGYYNSPLNYFTGTSLNFAMPLFLGFVSACQMLPLRHAVKQPWLWFLANVVAGIAFTGVLGNNNYNSGFNLFMLLLALLALALITGLTILHLFERHLLPMNPEGIENLPPKGPSSVWDDAV